MAESVNGQRHDRNALILYGSETGNGQDVAGDLGRVAERLHFMTRVSEMDLVEINILSKYTVVILVISTTGQGEFPKNSRKFWRSLLRKRLPPGCLNHVSFTTFGLGDSSYPKFNWAARKLHKRLEQLGAKEVYPRGEADEQHQEGIDGTFLSWSVDFRKHLLSSYPLPDGVNPIPQEVLLPPKYVLKILDESLDAPKPQKSSITDPESSEGRNRTSPTAAREENVTSCSLSAEQQYNNIDVNLPLTTPELVEKGSNMLYKLPVDHEQKDGDQLKEGSEDPPTSYDERLPSRDLIDVPDGFEVKLIENKRVTPPTHWQDVRHLTFIMADHIKYEPGDTMTIYPKNFPEDVQSLIDLMGWNEKADIPLTFEVNGPKFYGAENLIPGMPTNLWPLPRTTLRQLLLHNLDITAIPKRHFFEVIAHHTSDSMHKERLLEFTNPAYTDEFFDYTTRPRRSMLEVLQDFPSVKLPWNWATSIFPVIRGRKFSIASGGVKRYFARHGFQKVELLVALVKYRTVLKKVRQGLCSRYLSSLPADTVLNVSFLSGYNFYSTIKQNPKSPAIFIAPGTGVAPCRSLIFDRARLAFTNGYDNVGRNVLFFGGRNQNADYFYKEEFAMPSLRTDVFTAFSRDQKEKIYVQDVIREQGRVLVPLLREQAVVFVCGSSGKMPEAVRQALLDVMVEAGGPWEPTKGGNIMEQCVKWLEWMEKNGRYVQETW